MVGLVPRALDDSDLFRCEVVEFIDKTVDLAVERGAFAFVEVLSRSVRAVARKLCSA